MKLEKVAHFQGELTFLVKRSPDNVPCLTQTDLTWSAAHFCQVWHTALTPCGVLVTWINFNPTMDK